MRLIPALFLIAAICGAPRVFAADPPPAPAAPASAPATAAPAPPPAMMMRILDEKKPGAQIHEAERAEELAEHQRREAARSAFLMEGLQMSIDLAVRLGRYAGTIILMLVVAGALGAVAALLLSLRRKYTVKPDA